MMSTPCPGDVPAWDREGGKRNRFMCYDLRGAKVLILGEAIQVRFCLGHLAQTILIFNRLRSRADHQV